MEIEKKEAQDLKAAEARSHAKNVESVAMSAKIVRRKPKRSTT
jgi:hypothetical protein